MIRYLAIRNLAVIESASIEFEPAFNTLTGETGAGKSILVGAVGLLLGGRASQDLVRTGQDLATVEAIFDADGEEILVRREITAQGRSRAFVSGTLATAATLKDLAGRLVELHGQHEHQQLLDPLQHLPLLDAWAGLAEQGRVVREHHATVHRIRQQLDRLRMDSRERAARLEFLSAQLNELKRASLMPAEDEDLAALRQVLRSADTIQRLCAESYGDLYESDDSVLTALGRIWKRVSELAAIDPRFTPYLDQRDAIRAQLDDLALTLRDYAESVDASPARLEQVEERLALIERLKRKYGPTLDDVLARQQELTAEHEGLTGSSSSVGDLEAALEAASRAYVASARLLSEARRSAGPRFSQALQTELADLAMDRARLEVRLTTMEGESGWTEHGIDRGEFFFSANPGEELRPLARIVSGGELSRVMLALKTMAVADQHGKTLIFDEVDAGIGGRVATVVGEKLRRLGERFQVLCITHLPQIAAAATTHFEIEKTVQGARTMTRVRRLSEEERVAEIGRMMGGSQTTAQVQASARELLALSTRPSSEEASRARSGSDHPSPKSTAEPQGRGDGGAAPKRGRR